MADSPAIDGSRADTRDDTVVGSAADQRPRTPRWVKVSGVIGLVVVVLVVILMLTGGAGQHGPGRHDGSGADGQAPPSGITPSVGAAGATGSGGAAGHAPPAGGHAR